jgi:hypothetical protein
MSCLTVRQVQAKFHSLANFIVGVRKRVLCLLLLREYNACHGSRLGWPLRCAPDNWRSAVSTGSSPIYACRVTVAVSTSANATLRTTPSLQATCRTPVPTQCNTDVRCSLPHTKPSRAADIHCQCKTSVWFQELTKKELGLRQILRDGVREYGAEVGIRT